MTLLVKKKWMATGPFSGCMVGVFTQGSNGVGLAHIHKGGRTDATVAWENFKKQDDVSVHYERRIPAPLKGNSCSYLFLDLTDKNSLMLSQIDLQVNGAADWGRVCHVKHVTGFSKV